jgi:hypothetical protein
MMRSTPNDSSAAMNGTMVKNPLVDEHMASSCEVGWKGGIVKARALRDNAPRQ